MAGRDLSAELFGEQKPTKGRDLSAELFGSAVPPSPTSGNETSWVQHAENLAAGALRGAGSIGATILAPADMINQKLRGEDFWSLEDNRKRRQAIDEGLRQMGAETDSAMYKTGKIGGEIAGTAGVGGVLGNAVRSVSATPKAAAIADALSSYGIGQAAKGVGYLPRIAAGAATGGAAGLMTNPDEAVTGALIGGIIPSVAPIVTGTGKLISSITGPMRESWRTHQGNRFLQEMLGEDAVQKAIKAIAAGKGAGQTTVADDIAAANMGRTDKFASPLVAIEEKLATQPGGLSDIAKSIVARQESGRMAGLEAVKPDLAKAVAAREVAAKPLYRQADKAVVTLDAPMMTLFERMPKGTLEAAEDIARMEGRTFQMGKYSPATQVASGVLDAAGKPIMKNVPASYPKITGESLHYLKRALSDVANSAPAVKGIGRDAQDAARLVLSDFTKAFEGKVPVYGQARATFAGKSPPVNQAKVIQSMQDVLSGQGGPERASSFQNVLGRGETALLKKSTGFPRYTEIDQVLNKQQMDAVTRVSKELARDAERTSLGASVDTKHLFEIADKSKGTISFPTLLSRPAMLANWIMRKVGTGADEMITQDMGKLMLSDPAAFSAKYLQEIPTTYRKQAFDVLMKNYGTPVIGVTAPIISSQQRRSSNDQNGLLSEPDRSRRPSASGLLN